MFAVIRKPHATTRTIHCECLKDWETPEYRMSAGSLGDIAEPIAAAAIEAGFLRPYKYASDPLSTKREVRSERRAKKSAEEG